MPDGGTSSRSEEQLAAISSLSRVLDENGLDYWLFGGWAVDFWVGRVTRAHDDIDVAAWRRDDAAIGSALTATGWQHTPVADEVVGTRYQWRSSQVEFTFVVTDDLGRVVIPLPGQSVLWSPAPLGDHRRELQGVRSRTIPLVLLKEGKSTPRETTAEAAKDRADFEALSEV